MCDDTDVFVMLLHYKQETKMPNTYSFMASPIKGRSMIDIAKAVNKHTYTSIVEERCDTVAGCFGIGKGTAIKVLQSGCFFFLLGLLDYISQSTLCMFVMNVIDTLS